MSAPELDPRWLAALFASADQMPRRPRLPLLWQHHVIGSAEADYFDQIDLKRPSSKRHLLQKEECSDGLLWRLSGGDATQTLRELAQALLAARVGHVAQHWRNEQLAVCNSLGQQVATVERGVVRPLGIATRAVHLVGSAPDGRFWVQQRALNKANDPGLWDTLMGGMVSASDTVPTALARETWEEAGLHTAALPGLQWGGRIGMRKPNPDPDDAGYVVEQIDWYRCTVPTGVQPVNQDGEVAQFELLDQSALVARLQCNQFTTEAALILVAAQRFP